MKSEKRSNHELDLNQIRAFVEVARAGSFAKAARHLGSPANSVSRHVQQLEADIGSRLIHRSTRKLSLTAAGRLFFDRCAPAIAELTQAGQQSAADNQVPSGVVRVAAPADFLDLLSPEQLGSFLERHPRISLEFVLDDAKADLVGQGIDVAVRAVHLIDDHHVGHKLVEGQFYLVASPRYIAAHTPPASLEALAAHDCLAQSNISGPTVWRLHGPRGPREIRVTGRFRANAARAVLRAAMAGLGIALLPAPIVIPEIRAGRLVRVLPEYQRKGADLYAVSASRRHIPRAVAAFIEFAAEQLRADATRGYRGS